MVAAHNSNIKEHQGSLQLSDNEKLKNWMHHFTNVRGFSK